jgi:hypothetical protein
MSPPRTGAILSALALAGCLLPAPSRVGHCLPTQAGDRLRAVLDAGVLTWTLPEVWTLRSAEIRQQVLELKLQGPDGTTRRILLDGPGTPQPVEGSELLRHFRVRFPDPASPGAREILLQAARWIDAGFSASPWVPCELPDMTPESRWLWHPPRWLDLGLGVLALALLLLALCHALRDPESPG